MSATHNERTETEAEARRPPAPVDWSGVRSVHVMGICGSAMGALAQMLRKRGLEVRGSDKGAYPPMSTRLASAGIHIYEGYAASNLDWGPDAVVVGNVVRPFYDEAIALRARGIPHCSLPQAIAGGFIAGRTSVVVTGTHGKTTTSSMAAWVLHEAGLDPGFMIGGVTGNFGTNHRVSDGPTFVVEGDEYDTAYFDKGPKFLHYLPDVAVINNVEFDHADIFADLSAVERVFKRFAAIVSPDGRLLIPHADPLVADIAEVSQAPLWTFGPGAGADVRADELVVDAAGTRFDLVLPESGKVPVRMVLWGRHNVLNALAAAGLAYAAGAEPRAIADGLRTFRLPHKRQEVHGVAADVPVVDDFAHHPTAIAETIRSVRQRWPQRRILALFEVESNTSRRRVFQDGFAAALSTADRVWFGRPVVKADDLAPEETLDLDQLVADLRTGGTPAVVIRDTEELAQSVAAEARPRQDVILVMSGRDFDGVHDRLLAALEQRESGPTL